MLLSCVDVSFELIALDKDILYDSRAIDRPLTKEFRSIDSSTVHTTNKFSFSTHQLGFHVIAHCPNSHVFCLSTPASQSGFYFSPSAGLSFTCIVSIVSYSLVCDSRGSDGSVYIRAMLLAISSNGLDIPSFP